MITVVFFSHSLFAVLYPWLLYRLCLGVFPSPFSLQFWRTLRLVWLRFGYDKSKLNSCLVITISTNLRHCNWLQLPEGHVCGLGILVQNSRWSRELKAPSTSKHSEKTQHSTSLIQIVDNPYERGKKISSASFSNQNLFVSVIFSFFPPFVVLKHRCPWPVYSQGQMEFWGGPWPCTSLPSSPGWTRRSLWSRHSPLLRQGGGYIHNQ